MTFKMSCDVCIDLVSPENQIQISIFSLQPIKSDLKVSTSRLGFTELYQHMNKVHTVLFDEIKNMNPHMFIYSLHICLDEML